MVIWERFTTKKIVVNGKEKFESRCEIWKYKWNTKWNILCVKIVAILSFTLLIAFIIHKNLTNSNEEIATRSLMRFNKIHYPTKNLNKDNQCDYQECSEYGFDHLCCFICKNVHITANTIDEIVGKHPEYMKNNCENKLVLNLEMCTYEDYKLVKNWSTIPISQLVINRNIEDIEDGAFNSQIFENIKRITLQFPNIRYYRKNMLQGLPNLEWFEIQNSGPLAFEENVLEHVSSTVCTLQVTASNLEDPISIKNLTSIRLPILKTIDLQYNKLKSLPSKAFHNTPSLVAIYLTNNSLPTLRKASFVSRIETISIENNDWICNCELYWMKSVRYIISVTNSKCLDGEEWKKFDTIFQMDCSNLPSTTESTTSDIPTSSSSEESSSVTTTTTITTTTETGEEISSTPSKSTPPTNTNKPEEETSPTPSKSTPSTSTEEPEEETPPTPSTSTPTTSTKNPEQEISPTPPKETPSTTITEKETDDGMSIPEDQAQTCTKNMVQDLIVTPKKHKLVIQYPDASNNASYYFFHSEDIKECKKSKSSSSQVEGIFEPNTSYTFCEVLPKEIQCLNGKTLPRYEDQTWLTNQNKIPVILIGTFVNLFSIVFSGVVTYCYLRKHPSLLQKNNNQPNFVGPSKPIYLASRRPQIFAPSSVHEELTLRHAPFVPLREQSIAYVPVSDGSYFSPIPDHYYVRKKPTLYRNTSDLSLRSAASYVTENQIMSWRKRSRKERAPVTKLFDEPPPLPPPRNRCDVVEENEVLAQSSRQYW